MVYGELMLAAAQPEEALSIRMYRLSVEQYHAMVAAGTLTENDQVELLEGWLIEKMAKNPPHGVAINLTGDALRSVLPIGWAVIQQDPITLATSEPEPDLALIRGTRRDYLTRHPTPPNIGLVVEVSDSTLKLDQTLKARIYAAAGIPHYWLLNLVDRQLEVHSQPTVTGYSERVILTSEADVTLLLDNQVIASLKVHDLLP